MDIFFEYKIAPASNLIRKVEKEAKELFDHVEEEVKTQTIMVLRELLENAIKYGEIRPSIKDINISFKADDEKILIKVSNAIIEEDHLNIFKEHLENIRNSDDIEALYTNRLRVLLENNGIGESRLGLYRIAYEGNFQLSYIYNSNLLTVIAQRKISIK